MYINLKKNLAKAFPALAFFLFFLFPLVSFAATLSIIPAAGTFETGQRVSVKIVATSNSVTFNAISGVVSFPTSIFSIESVSKANSVLNFWVTEPTITSGNVKFEGIALGGYGGTVGTAITVNLRAVKAGSGLASFSSGQILANDGEGTDITGNLIGASYTVVEAPPQQPAPTPEPTPTPEPETPQPPPTLAAPQIMQGTKYGALAIVGTSLYPNSTVLLTFASTDQSKIFIQGTSDSSGGFNLLVPSSLKRGTYAVTAVMIREDKTNSEPSNELIIKVGSIFSDLGWEVSLFILLLILAILYLLLRIHQHRGKNWREAENVVHKSFDILREDVTDYDNEKLPPTEHKRMTAIKKDINDAEKIISKEIKDS